jgi:hypothetical protein
MKWAHLPVAGGLYDQHPILMEKFEIIFQLRAQKEAREQAKRDAEQRRNSRGTGGRGRRR